MVFLAIHGVHQKSTSHLRKKPKKHFTGPAIIDKINRRFSIQQTISKLQTVAIAIIL